MRNKLEELSFNSGTSVNDMTYGALSLRLDTKSIIEDIELFLKGQAKAVDIDTRGVQTIRFVKISEPLANPRGIHAILSSISSLFNSSNAQGNFNKEQYDWFIFEFHKEFAKDLMINLHTN